MFWFIVYAVASYCFLNVLQRRAGIMYFGSIGQYFTGKIVLSLLFGWVIIPVGIICALMGKLADVIARSLERRLLLWHPNYQRG